MGMGIDWFFLSIFIDYYVIFRNCVNDLDINVFVICINLLIIILLLLNLYYVLDVLFLKMILIFYNR